jgi:SAM-dependent methyltransferase
MDYKAVYTEGFYDGDNSFFYRLGYDKKFSPIYFSRLFKFREIKKHIREIKAGSVLDIGCGYAFMLDMFPDSFKKFGMDVSEHAIDEARRRLPGSELKVGNAEVRLPFEDNFFDIILLNDVIEHLENPGEALRHIFRTMKKGGILYITTPNLNVIRKRVYRYADEKDHHISMFAHSDLCELLKASKFRIEKHWTFFTGFIYLKLGSNMGTESAFICRISDV